MNLNPCAPMASALVTGVLTAVLTGCGSTASGEQPPDEPSATATASGRHGEALPSASASPAREPLAQGLPQACEGSAAADAAAPHVRGLPFGETAEGSVLTCRWGKPDTGKRLFVQFQTGETFADPEGADPEAEATMGLYTTPVTDALGGKLQYVDLGTQGRNAVLYLPGVSVAATSVGLGLAQEQLVEIVVAGAGDLPA
ncbi:hypothetical protein [Nocardiopsis ansamitocini]|uniref:DUF3558 domain-containing protein n=1 Tax=Nocardiopsis ansamitocini TaxID=1670832 RepID=A0A9W6PBF1_9ACTN|nr:hypothetical protein [Nocardiopsis ansamitocini]GLU50457.1 hypothetical protein Nans01_48080 [Nocardiopsis ansamitocini]